MANATRDAIAFILANPEMFASALKKDGTFDVSALESQAVRGDALNVIGRKTTFSDDAKSEFCDAIFSLAADFEAGVKKSGTSGNRRMTVATPSGSFTLELKDNEE